MDISDFRDNIVNKVEENKKLEQFKNYISKNCMRDEELKVSISSFKKSIKLPSQTVNKIIQKIIEDNEKLIDLYLRYSFEVKPQKEENTFEQVKKSMENANKVMAKAGEQLKNMKGD